MKTTISAWTIVKLRRVPPDDLRKVLEFVADGGVALDIMERHHIRVDTAFQIWRKYGLALPERRTSGRAPRVPDAVRAAVMEDYAAGMPMAEIELKHSLHRCTVWAIRREIGTPARFPNKGPRRRGPRNAS